MNIDLKTLEFWLKIVTSVLVPMGVVVYTYFATRDKNNDKHIKEVEGKLNEALPQMDKRIQIVETQLEHMPDAKDLYELQGDLKVIKQQQSSTQDLVKQTQRSVVRIEEYLFKKGD